MSNFYKKKTLGIKYGQLKVSRHNKTNKLYSAADGPDGTCTSLACQNGGHCVMKRVHQTRVATCDCELTTFMGRTCEDGQ